MKAIFIILIALLIPIEISCNESSTAFDSDESEQNNFPDISSYPLVSTNQSIFFDNNSENTVPAASESFYGQDVHSAGAQRSDPKIGNPEDFPTSRGPQGDAIRIFNYVRCMRDVNGLLKK